MICVWVAIPMQQFWSTLHSHATILVDTVCNHMIFSMRVHGECGTSGIACTSGIPLLLEILLRHPVTYRKDMLMSYHSRIAVHLHRKAAEMHV